jgi:ABC-type nitrate/sulfonate/bicarbonate transport system substrate-binding protein
MNNKQRIKATGGRIVLAFALALAFILVCAACSGGSGSASQNGGASASQDGGGASDSQEAQVTVNEPFVIRAARGSSPDIVVADKLGFFADEGITIEWTPEVASGVSVYQIMEQGIVDITSSHPPTIAQAILAGIKVKAIAPGAVDNERLPHVYYLVRNDSDIQNIEDAAGKKVGIMGIVPCMNGFVIDLVSKQGGNANTIDFVTLSQPGQMEQVLIDGEIDLSTSHGEAGLNALATGEVRCINTTWDYFGSIGTGLAPVVVQESLIEERPDIVQGLVNALYRARLWITDNTWSPDGAGSWDIPGYETDPETWKYSEYSKLYADVYKELGRTIPESGVRPITYDTHKNIQLDHMKFWFDLSESIGLWEAGQIRPEDVFTNDFVPEDAPESDKTLTYADVIGAQ